MRREGLVGRRAPGVEGPLPVRPAGAVVELVVTWFCFGLVLSTHHQSTAPNPPHSSHPTHRGSGRQDTGAAQIPPTAAPASPPTQGLSPPRTRPGGPPAARRRRGRMRRARLVLSYFPARFQPAATPPPPCAALLGPRGSAGSESACGYLCFKGHKLCLTGSIPTDPSQHNPRHPCPQSTQHTLVR